MAFHEPASIPASSVASLGSAWQRSFGVATQSMDASQRGQYAFYVGIGQRLTHPRFSCTLDAAHAAHIAAPRQLGG